MVFYKAVPIIFSITLFCTQAMATQKSGCYKNIQSLTQPVGYKKAKKIRVGVFFGGQSAEHEVSLNSARNIITALDPAKYEVLLIGIDKDGRWHINNKKFLTESDSSGRPILQRSMKTVSVVPGRRQRPIVVSGKGKKDLQLDVIFPVLHGTNGEDGTMQGLLKTLDVPFVGSGVLGSVVGMDKDVMKRLLKEADLPIGKFLLTQPHRIVDFETAERKLGLPFFIKPANAGSSVGVFKIKSKEDFERLIPEAFKYDHKVLIEEFIPGREIEVAVLGNLNPQASIPGEIVVHTEFYDYRTKYLDPDGASLSIPAKLDPAVAEQIRLYAVQVFRTLGTEGLARVDFFLTKDNKIYVNEINTLPGFTKSSMYPKLWEASGIPYSQLVNELIELALERHQRDKKLITSFELPK